MTDLTPILNELLKSYDARPTANPSLTLQNIDEFLKEAYRIVSSVTLNLVRIVLISPHRIRIYPHSMPICEGYDNLTCQQLPPLDAQICLRETSNGSI
jgi:hypothetical protein